MRRAGLFLTAGLAAAGGCKLFDRERTPAEPASRSKDPDKPADWLDGPAARDLPPATGAKRKAPPADSWANPTDPNYDVRNEVRGLLAGSVEDPDGKKLGGVSIDVQPAELPAAGTPVGVETRPGGDFIIKGLKPGQTYILTARVKQNGKELSDQTYVKPPNARILMKLVEGLNLPPTRPPAAPPAEREKPAYIPPPVLPGGSAQALPPFDRDDSATVPAGADLPARDPLPRATPAGRADLITEGDPTWRPPVANIPSTGGAKRESRTIRQKADFTLLDTAGKPRAFPPAAGWVLLDFMTTECVPCKKAIPTLAGVQDKFGRRGLEVVGVACDEAAPAQRRAVAARYHRDHRLNYDLYVEPGDVPGGVMQRFGVDRFPTLVLVGPDGGVAWKGHPRDVADLEATLADVLR